MSEKSFLGQLFDGDVQPQEQAIAPEQGGGLFDELAASAPVTERPLSADYDMADSALRETNALIAFNKLQSMREESQGQNGANPPKKRQTPQNAHHEGGITSRSSELKCPKVSQSVIKCTQD